MTVSHLTLRHATSLEIEYIHACNAASWAGDLNIETYRARERVLASTPLTRNGGIRCWVLVDPSDPSTVLSSCETIKKDAFVSTPPLDGDVTSMVKEVTAHGVGSVFTPVEYRGKGYAGAMLGRLADNLKRSNHDGFSVLYSDIGKRFYSRLGWLPHRSSHLEFPAARVGGNPPIGSFSSTKLLRSSDVPSLCVKDISSIEETLSKPSTKGPMTRIAFIPDYRSMEWHWAREEFVAPVLRNHINDKPEIKGAITADGKRWMIWTRDFGKSSQLTIIRLVNISRNLDETEHVEQLAALFRAAGQEAAKWDLQKVYMWNPDELTVRAARKAAGEAGVTVVDREADSIASLMMHHEKEGSGPEYVDWEVNEKYAWC